MEFAALEETSIRLAAHPNELDRKRIERALKTRRRYRYVSPSVAPVTDGYRIESPCCSRNIDPDGGTVDVALLRYDASNALWQLFRKDHKGGGWKLHNTYDRLIVAVDEVNIDPARTFWQ